MINNEKGDDNIKRRNLDMVEEQSLDQSITISRKRVE